MRAEDAALNTAGVHKAWQRCLAAIADMTVDGEPHCDARALHQQVTRRHAAACAPSRGWPHRGLTTFVSRSRASQTPCGPPASTGVSS
jgi:hypothetical protein